MRKPWLWPMLFFVVAVPLASQGRFALGDRVVSQQEYEAALPYVNADGVRVCNYPATELSTVRFLLSAGTLVNVHYVTAELDEIQGSTSVWYWVGTREGPPRHGWVFGRYLSFRDGYSRDFWRPESISRTTLEGGRLVSLLIVHFLAGTEDAAPATWIEGRTPAAMSSPRYPHFEAYTELTYCTDFGSVRLLYKEGEADLPVSSIEILSPDSHLPITVGDSLSKLKQVLGNGGHDDGTAIFFTLDRRFSEYQLRVGYARGTVTKLAASRLLYLE